jgi:hypothetical protein
LSIKKTRQGQAVGTPRAYKTMLFSFLTLEQLQPDLANPAPQTPADAPVRIRVH